MGKKRTATEANGGGAPAVRKADKPKDAPQKTTKAGQSKKSAAGGKESELIFTPRPDWHASELPPLPTIENASTPPNTIVDDLLKHANILLEAENARYGSTHLASSSSHKFLSTIMSSGTLEDKVSALTLVVQESPVHTMKSFDDLLGLAKKRSRNQALMALGALKDLLGQGVVLPPDRKLTAFGRQPGLLAAVQGKSALWTPGRTLPGQITNTHLISWAYEDWLKKTYFELLKVLEGWCNDEVEHARSRSVTFVWELLKEKPEQEENLLRLLVNKLGDKEKKIASRASYLLLQLQVTHPLMKSIVINAIESDILFRPRQSAHAKYYGIITLNQTILSMKEQEVANKLLEVYFGLFVNLFKTNKTQPTAVKNSKGQLQGGGGKPGKKARQKEKLTENASKAEDELKEKMVAQVLTGVNRAFPFAKTDDATFESQLDTIFRVTHSSNFNTSVQALILIHQISAAKHFSADRFYRTLYESLLDPRLLTSSKQILYLNLLYRALKTDVSIKRVKSFVKRLLQIVTLHEPPFACGILYLVRELETTFPSIKGMLDQPEDIADNEEEHFVDAPEDGSDAAAVPTEQTSATTKPTLYDGRKRDPEHSNAERSCLWELLPFQAHFHPSVSLFASRLLHAEPMPEKPDPTRHTLIHFLDRFAYRNAKAKVPTRGISIMQPLAGAATSDRLLHPGGTSAMPVNSEAFWRKKSEDVAVDEVFFHQYFNQDAKRKTRAEKRGEKARKGEESSEESEGEDEIWKAIVESRTELEGADDGDEDLEDDSDMDDSEDEGPELDIADVMGSDDEDADPGAEDKNLSDDFDVGELESDDDVASDIEAALPQVLNGEDEEDKGKDKKRSKKRRKLKHLPTFASVEDYARLMGDDDEDGE